MKSLKKNSVHVLVWLAFVFLMNSKPLGLAWGMFSREEGSIFLPLFYGTAIGAFIFYFNVRILIPNYFSKNKKIKYLLYAFLLFLGASMIETIMDLIVLVNKNYELVSVKLKEAPLSEFINWIIVIFLNVITANLVCWIFAFAYKFPIEWVKSERQKNELEKDKLRSELDFLKAQINPHFLFNGINSIYHLIGEDNAMAKSTMLQFSGLLRYQLYDCSVNYISIEKELDYINNYINIEKVRKGEDAIFTFNLPNVDDVPMLKKFKIAPLLITPFLENAFKYLSHFSNRDKNFIKLNLNITKAGILTMDLSNSYDDTFKIKKDSSGGIGLENVKRRLQILYPDKKNNLKITASGNVFLVNLMLNINED